MELAEQWLKLQSEGIDSLLQGGAMIVMGLLLGFSLDHQDHYVSQDGGGICGERNGEEKGDFKTYRSCLYVKTALVVLSFPSPPPRSCI